MKFILLNLFIFIPFFVSYAQTTEVPVLEKVKSYEKTSLFITVGLNYDASNQLIFNVGEHFSSEIDSLKPFLSNELRKNH